MDAVQSAGTASAAATALTSVSLPVPAGQREIDGERYWTNGSGGLIPDVAVKATDKLQDELVRKIIGFAEPLSAQVARFRQHCFDDVDMFVQLLDQEYGAKRGGTKGNLTFISFDGLMKITVAVAESIDFGPELQTAKTIVDECLRAWSADSHAHIRTLITRAFEVDTQGRINRASLLSLMRLDFPDKRWQEAMRAIKDSIRPIGSKRYIRMHKREHAKAAWTSITIDVSAE